LFQSSRTCWTCFVGRSERNLHEGFASARRNALCVLFFDEVDALGQRRSQTRNTAIRSTVNQLLLELDDLQADNDGVYVLGATNQPWDVDSALRRPGRFDRTVLVLPPDLQGAAGDSPVPPARAAGGRHRSGRGASWPVGFAKSVHYAACAYSLISPSRMGWRRTSTAVEHPRA
jgi:hypothetical protein